MAVDFKNIYKLSIEVEKIIRVQNIKYTEVGGYMDADSGIIGDGDRN